MELTRRVLFLVFCHRGGNEKRWETIVETTRKQKGDVVETRVKTRAQALETAGLTLVSASLGCSASDSPCR